MDYPSKLPTVLSLCTGYGGIERGLELAGFAHRVVAHVEIEAFAVANLVAKMEERQLVPTPIWTDLKTLPVDCFRDRVDLLTGGYPCQPFSNAGKRQGEDDPRHLWPHIKRHIETIRPVQCFFENVEGHISLGLREVIEDLESLGYSTTWGVFSAAEVGAPHQRKRVYILAALQHTNPNSGDGSAQQECQHQRAQELSRSGAGPVGSLVANSDNAGQQPSEGQLGSPEARHNAGRSGEEGKFIQELVTKDDKPAKPGERAYHPKTGKHSQITLNRAVKMFPTPTSRDYKGGYRENAMTRRDGKSRRFDALPNAAINGQGTDAIPSGVHLSADWVEGLMGLPLGWTDLGNWGCQE